MGNTATPVSAHYTVPCGMVHLIKVLLDAFCYVLLGTVQFNSLSGTEYSRALHLHWHICSLDFQLCRLLIKCCRSCNWPRSTLLSPIGDSPFSWTARIKQKISKKAKHNQQWKYEKYKSNHSNIYCKNLRKCLLKWK